MSNFQTKLKNLKLFYDHSTVWVVFLVYDLYLCITDLFTYISLERLWNSLNNGLKYFYKFIFLIVRYILQFYPNLPPCNYNSGISS